MLFRLKTNALIYFYLLQIVLPRAPGKIISWSSLRSFVTEHSGMIVINTWPVTSPTEAAWNVLSRTPRGSAIDAVVAGCTVAEEDTSFTTVGYGGSPDENGDTALDALIMDGDSMNVGAVAAMPFIKEAIQTANAVRLTTKHTLLVGEEATHFAVSRGFKRTDLSTNSSKAQWNEWKRGNCQPNYRVMKYWTPDPQRHCGPYTGIDNTNLYKTAMDRSDLKIDEDNHDTIGMIALDGHGSMAVGLSTNGARFRIPGRVGDTPIPGAGGYVDSKVGGAVGTGDGDVLMRFLLSFRAVELMRSGVSATTACEESLKTVRQKGNWSGGLVCLKNSGEYGAACIGFQNFAISVRNGSMNTAIVEQIVCKSN